MLTGAGEITGDVIVEAEATSRRERSSTRLRPSKLSATCSLQGDSIMRIDIFDPSTLMGTPSSRMDMSYPWPYFSWCVCNAGEEGLFTLLEYTRHTHRGVHGYHQHSSRIRLRTDLDHTPNVVLARHHSRSRALCRRVERRWVG